MDATSFFIDRDRSIMLDDCHLLSREEERLTANEMDLAAKQIIQELRHFKFFRGWMIRTLNRIITRPKSGMKKFRRDGEKITLEMVSARLLTIQAEKKERIQSITTVELSLKFHFYEQLIRHLLANSGSWTLSDRWPTLLNLWSRWDSARTKLIRANLRLAINLAKGFQDRGLSLADLCQEAVSGLVRHMGDFEVGRRRRVSTFISLWIKQQIQGAIATKTRDIRLPHYATTQMSKFRRDKKLLSQRRDSTHPTFDEICDCLNLNKKARRKMRLMLAASYQPSLDGLLDDDDDGSALISILPGQNADNSVELEEQLAVLGKAIGENLSERERYVITELFGLTSGKGKTLEAVGDTLDLTKERVRQIREAALDKLKATFCQL